jgi:predicted transcriptional regulator
MYTVTEIAQKCGVTSQAVYRRLNGNLADVMKGHIHKGRGGKTLIDEEGAAILLDRVGPNAPEVQPEDPVQAPTATPDAATVAILRETIDRLRADNERLQTQLDAERTASRAQTERTLALAEQLARLTENSQILLKQQQEAQRLPEVTYTQDHAAEPTPSPVEQPQAEEKAAEKRGFLSRIFGK